MECPHSLCCLVGEVRVVREEGWCSSGEAGDHTFQSGAAGGAGEVSPARAEWFEGGAGLLPGAEGSGLGEH